MQEDARQCAVCEKADIKLFRCSRCKSVYYCSQDHQKEDWRGHKKVCRSLAQRDLLDEKEINNLKIESSKSQTTQKEKKEEKEEKKEKSEEVVLEEYMERASLLEIEGKRQEALVIYHKALAECKPNDYNLLFHVAVCHAQEGNLEETKTAYLKAVAQEPNFPLPTNQDRHAFDVEVVDSSKWRFALICRDAGDRYRHSARFDPAVHHYKIFLAFDPCFANFNNISVTYHAMGMLHEAQWSIEEAVRLGKDKGMAYNNMGTMYRDEGRAVEAVDCFAKCIELDPVQSAGRFGAYHNRLLAMNSLPAFDESTREDDDPYNDRIWQAHKNWGDEFEARYKQCQYAKWPNELTTDRPVRVGYLSSDLRTHPVSYFIEAPLKFMDSQRVDTFVYLNGPPGDARTHELRQCVPKNRWKMLGSRNPEQICELFRSDKIDILVELGGHASGNRLDIAVRRPCPLQVTWIGYANTTGIPCIDYRITDPLADPVNTKQGYSEELARMPEPCGFLCYTGSPYAPLPKELPALKNGYITFGSFNTLSKAQSGVFDVWFEILRKIPSSRVFLKCKGFASAPMKRKFLKRFLDAGITPDRIKMMTHVMDRKYHLDLYNLIDIGLDTFPYAGTTTSCEAIWMGVPVITLNRAKFPIHCQNVGTTLFSRIPDLRGFIAKDKKSYVNLAMKWADPKNRKKLAEVRANLRENMKKSPLCDGPLYCSKLAELYEKMWRDYVNKHKTEKSEPASEEEDDEGTGVNQAK